MKNKDASNISNHTSKDNMSKRSESYSYSFVPTRISVARFLCPSFCRTKRKEETEKQVINHYLTLSDEELTHIFRFLGVDEEDGFTGMFPYKLHNIWEEFMMPDLYEIWTQYIYGSTDDITPNFENFCTLVKGQWSAPMDVKVKTIFSVLSRHVYIEMENTNVELVKYDVIKYFFDLMATYLRGMGFRNNPEFLMWVSSDAAMNENNLRIGMRFFTEMLSDMVCKTELTTLMTKYPILPSVLTSVIEMSFGIAPLTNRIIPFPISTTHTMLDIAQIVLLTSFIKQANDDLYEWELLYCTQNVGFSWTVFVHAVIRRGPTIIILKDKDGWVFGGYCSKSWRISPKFFGNKKCFMFRLVPVFKVFRASDSNQNFMYLNHGQHTMPNGLGMGGHMDYFGLWIDIDKRDGRCENQCATFEDFECLANRNNFQYVAMEVWRVSPRYDT